MDDDVNRHDVDARLREILRPPGTVVDRVVSGALGRRQSPMSRAPGSRWRWAAVTAVALLIVSIGTWQRIVLRQPTVQVNAAPPRSGGHYVIVVPASEVAP